MGSFDVACAASNITINCGDPIVFLPLEVNRYANKLGDGSHHLIYAWCYYNPVCLPIFGTYDDYGRIGKIKRDLNVDVVENFFNGQKIEDLCDPMGCNIPPIASGMFIHEPIFNAVKKLSRLDEFGEEHGMSYGGPDDMQDALNKTYNDFVVAIRKAEELEGMFRRDLKIRSRDLLYISSEDHNAFNFRNFATMQEMYRPHILGEKLKEAMKDFVMFDYGFGSTNNIYFPTQNGWQHGNHYASHELYEAGLELLNEKFKEREDD